MFRICAQFRRRTAFHDLPQIHDHDPAGNVFHHCEIVGNEKKRHAGFLLDLLKQVHDLRLHTHIQRRDRLIRHDKTGIYRQCPGDPDPLTLSAAELVRVTPCVCRVQPHHFHQFRDSFLPAGFVQIAVQFQRLFQHSVDAHTGIQ